MAILRRPVKNILSGNFYYIITYVFNFLWFIILYIYSELPRNLTRNNYCNICQWHVKIQNKLETSKLSSGLRDHDAINCCFDVWAMTEVMKALIKERLFCFKYEDDGILI